MRCEGKGREGKGREGKGKEGFVASSERVHVHGNCYQNFVSLYFEVREFSSYSRGDFRLSYQFKFFCVILLPISLKSLCSEAFTKP